MTAFGCETGRMRKNGKIEIYSHQLLAPTGLREERYLCLWRQLNQDISFPVHLIVDEGMNACFASAGKIIEWFTSGEYFLSELDGIETSAVETAVGWNKLRLFYFVQVSEIKLHLRSDSATANIDIECKVRDAPTFWSYYLKPSYTKLCLTDVIHNLCDRIEEKLPRLFRLYPTFDYTGDNRSMNSETPTIQIEEYLRDAPCFDEFGLLLDSLSVSRYERIIPKKFGYGVDWSDEADIKADPLRNKASTDSPYLKITVRESHAIDFRYMSKPVTKLCGFAVLTQQNQYFYLNTVIDKVGIHVLSWSASSVTITVTPLDKSKYYKEGQESSKRIVLTPGTQQQLYHPLIFDAGYTYLIEYKLPVKGKIRGILRWVFMRNCKREG